MDNSITPMVLQYLQYLPCFNVHGDWIACTFIWLATEARLASVVGHR